MVLAVHGWVGEPGAGRPARGPTGIPEPSSLTALRAPGLPPAPRRAGQPAGAHQYVSCAARRGECDDDHGSTRPRRLLSQAGGRWHNRGGSAGRRPPPVTEQAADQAVTAMYQTHYRTLVRAAALLVGDPATAEDVVQDSFIAIHRAWRRLRDPGKALPYLRRSVINNSRSVLRHGAVAGRYPLRPEPELPSAEESALAAVQRSSVLAALAALPARQREVLVLRYYADLSEAQIAAAMGISRGAVKSHAARAKGSLRALLDAYREPSAPRQPRALRHQAAAGPGR
jgi:RNA polymerase sigma-70 factor (sigma-E family)